MLAHYVYLNPGAQWEHLTTQLLWETAQLLVARVSLISAERNDNAGHI